MREAPISIVRFTERAHRQCRRSGGAPADRRVCNAVANGIRTQRAGGTVLFHRPARGACGPVRVLGRMTGDGCLVLKVLSGLGSAKKTPKMRDF